MQTLTTDAAKFLEVAETFPVEMRIAIVDRLLESIRPTDPEVEGLWIAEANKRAEEIRSGKVTAKPGDVFLNEARNKLGL